MGNLLEYIFRWIINKQHFSSFWTARAHVCNHFGHNPVEATPFRFRVQLLYKRMRVIGESDHTRGGIEQGCQPTVVILGKAWNVLVFVITFFSNIRRVAVKHGSWTVVRGNNFFKTSMVNLDILET